jgi:hypothetical protein
MKTVNFTQMKDATKEEHMLLRDLGHLPAIRPASAN